MLRLDPLTLDFELFGRCTGPQLGQLDADIGELALHDETGPEVEVRERRFGRQGAEERS